ncbi:MAG TPA: 7-cyano-7-deazaguanine synthase, partial [Acidimicrobiales bacterium]
MPGHLVILSGGLDSTVCMALAAGDGGRPPLALSFDYGQSHRIELDRAATVARWFGSEHLVVALDATQWGGSALTDPTIAIPDGGVPDGGVPDGGAPDGAATSADAIPATYVPAR